MQVFLIISFTETFSQKIQAPPSVVIPLETGFQLKEARWRFPEVIHGVVPQAFPSLQISALNYCTAAT